MKKTVILYVSVHHKNTEKLVKGIASGAEVDFIDILSQEMPDLSAYALVGFASGVYYGSLHEKIRQCISETVFKEGQKVFLISTCGVAYRDYTKKTQKVLKEKNVDYAGTFQCRGFDTFGPFGKIGGIAKKHPNQTDIQKAINFITHLMNA